MDINDLSLYITLAEKLHFRKTSEAHHITVSTLTRLIQRLEKELNTTLFDRNNRTVTLTQNGQKVYEFAKKTRASLAHLKQALHPKSPKELTGHIKLHSTVTAAYYILPPIIKLFRHQYPLIRPYLETGEIKQGYDQLLSNEVDFSIGIITKTKLNQCLCKKILQTPLVYITPKHTSKSVLFETPMILPEQGDLATIITTYLNTLSMAPPIHSYIKGHEAILAMVSAGLGNAILPKIVIDNSHLSHTIQIVTPKKPLPNLDVGIFVKKQPTLSPTKNAFWKFINEQYSQ